MVCPAYNELVKKYGEETSEDWAAESAHMIKEHTEARGVISADITKHHGEVAKIITSHKMAWQKDFKVLAGFGVHCKLTVLADAAHAQNEQLFGTAEMESYYKSRHDFKYYVGGCIHIHIVCKGRDWGAETKAQALQWEQEEAF
jgi:hypothetical protein